MAATINFKEEPVETQVYENFEQLSQIQPEWDQFVESLNCDIFLTYDWCRIWWKYYGGGRILRIFVYRDKGKLVAILPTFVETIRIGIFSVKVARILSTTHSLEEINPPVAEPYMSKVVGQWLEGLYLEFKPDIVCIGPISGTYDKTDRLADECDRWSNHRYVVEKTDKGVQTIFRLGRGWDEYLSNLPRRARHEINRQRRNILKNSQEDVNQVVCKVVLASELPVAFDEFVRMHNIYWQTCGQPGHFNDWPDSVKFHREITQAQLKLGRLRLFKMCIGDNCVEYDYAYNFSGTYFHLLNGRTIEPMFRNISVGAVAFSEVAMKASDEGVSLINSMRGKYEYKMRLGGVLVPIHTILVLRKNLVTSLRIRTFRCLSRMINFCYYRVWFSRIAPKLPWRRRPLWKLWIRTNAFA
jgi:CelD/BcsL family acetyltransferase involved in cellulose biosynthesis